MVSTPMPLPVTESRSLLVASRLIVGDTESGAEVALERVAHDHDARFDQYLFDGYVEGLHQAPDVREFVRRVLHQQGVGALIDGQGAASRQHGLLATRGLDQFGQIRDLGIVDLHEFRAGRRQILDFPACRKLGLLARSKFRGGSDDDDIVLAPLIQSLGAQHDVESLVPRHILQTQASGCP